MLDGTGLGPHTPRGQRVRHSSTFGFQPHRTRSGSRRQGMRNGATPLSAFQTENIILFWMKQQRVKVY